MDRFTNFRRDNIPSNLNGNRNFLPPNQQNDNQEQPEQNQTEISKTAEVAAAAIDTTKKVKDKIVKAQKTWKILTIIGPALLWIAVVSIVLIIILTPFLYFRDELAETGEKLVNFVTGCGWKNNEECDRDKQENFYTKINDVYEIVKENTISRTGSGGVEINRDLLVATFTYQDPFFTDKDKKIKYCDNGFRFWNNEDPSKKEDGVENDCRDMIDEYYDYPETYEYDSNIIISGYSDATNYKKNKAQVDYLADRMLKKYITVTVAPTDKLKKLLGKNIPTFSIGWVWGEDGYPYSYQTKGDVRKSVKEQLKIWKNDNRGIDLSTLSESNLLSIILNKNNYIIRRFTHSLPIVNQELNNDKYWVVNITSKYELDTDKYRDFLQGTNETQQNPHYKSYVTQFYYSETSKIDDCKVNTVQCHGANNFTNDIFNRVSYVKYLDDKEVIGTPMISQSVKVKLYNGSLMVEEVTLSDYLMGVIYAEMGDTSSDEYLKYLALLVKNNLYATNNASPDKLSQYLSTNNNAYCSVKTGCHYVNGILVSGASNGTYYKPPLDSSGYEYARIKKAVEETLSEFLLNGDTIVKANYTNYNKDEIENQLTNSSYKDLLASTYGGSIEELSLNTKAYPLDSKYNYVTSAYGWRFNPVSKTPECRHHGGVDIGASCDANIYAIADGVVVLNEYHYSFGNYIIIGHGNKNANGTYEYYSLYAHQIRLSSYVKVGSTVNAGQQIGNVGSTGDSTGCHLHIEIREGSNSSSNRIDPINFLNSVAELNNPYGGVPEYPSESACKTALKNKYYAYSNPLQYKNVLAYDYASYLKELR